MAELIIPSPDWSGILRAVDDSSLLGKSCRRGDRAESGTGAQTGQCALAAKQ